MNAALVFLSSACIAADVPPAAMPPAVPPPAVGLVQPAPAHMPAPAHIPAPAAGCDGCGAAPAPSCDCEEKPNLMSKLRARFGSRSSCECEKPGLFTKLKGKFSRSSACGCEPPVAGCEPCAAPNGCALPPVHAGPATPIMAPPGVMAAPPGGMMVPPGVMAPPPATTMPPATTAPAGGEPKKVMPKADEPKVETPVEKKSSLRPVPSVIVPVGTSPKPPVPLGGSGSPF